MVKNKFLKEAICPDENISVWCFRYSFIFQSHFVLKYLKPHYGAAMDL